MAKCQLKVPPKYPELDEIWIREDGQEFIWNGNEWEKVIT